MHKYLWALVLTDGRVIYISDSRENVEKQQSYLSEFSKISVISNGNISINNTH